MAKEMDWDAATERRYDAINIKVKEQNKCNQHPDAPHGFDRNASHNAGRYVCDCEGWKPPKAEQEPVAWRFELKAGEFAFCSQKHAEANRYMLTPENHAIPLYTAPPQREWVEPNAEHLEQVLHEKVMDMRMTNSDFAKAIIKLCKEANQ